MLPQKFLHTLLNGAEPYQPHSIPPNWGGPRCHGPKGAGKFLGVRRIFPEVRQTCPKVWCDFWPGISGVSRYPCFWQTIYSHKEPFLVWPPKKGFVCFSANVGHHFLKSNNVGHHFCPDFQVFWPDFQGFFPDFNKSKHLGVRFHPLHHRFLHHSPWKIHFWPLPEKKTFWRPCLGVHAHLPKCWKGTWPEKVWEPLF